MRYKQRAFSNYGTAKKTTNVAKRNASVKKARESVGADPGFHSDNDLVITTTLEDDLAAHRTLDTPNNLPKRNLDALQSNDELQQYWSKPSRYFPTKSTPKV